MEKIKLSLNWEPISTITTEHLSIANILHCDTRDFHCKLNEKYLNINKREQPELHRLLKTNDDSCFVSAHEMLQILNNLAKASGGDKENSWRFLTFKDGIPEGLNRFGNWVKYFRCCKIKNTDNWLICLESDEIWHPVNKKYLVSDNISKEVLHFDN